MFRYRFKNLAYEVETLHPAYFALVMATGIVAISCYLEGLRTIAVCLSWFNAASFVTLWILYLLRLAFYPLLRWWQDSTLLEVKRSSSTATTKSRLECGRYLYRSGFV